MDKIMNFTIVLGIFASILMILYLLVYIVKKPSIFDKLIASDLLAMPLICLIVLVSMYYKYFRYNNNTSYSYLYRCYGSNCNWICKTS